MGSFFLYEHQKGNNIEKRSWLLQAARNSHAVSVGQAWQGGLLWVGVTFSVQKGFSSRDPDKISLWQIISQLPSGKTYIFIPVPGDIPAKPMGFNNK